MPLSDTGHPQRRSILAVMCLALATVVSAVASLNVALPDLARATRATQTELQWVVDAYALAFAALLLSGGALGDRFGRRRALLAGLSIFGAGSLLAMTLDDPTALTAVRAVLGVGAALVMPATLSTITTVFPERERGSAVSLWTGVAGASAVGGLLVSGALLELFSWPSVFGLNVALAAAAIAGTVLLVPESANRDEALLDPIGAILSGAGLGTLVYAVIEGPERGWADAVTVAGFATAAVGLLLFVAWELRRAQPMLDPRLFLRPRFGAGALAITLQFFGFFGFVFLILQYFQLIRGHSPLMAALMLVPMAICLMATSRRSPALVDRFGAARVVPVGLVLIATGFALLSTLDQGTSYWVILPGLVLLGVGMGLSAPSGTQSIVDGLPAAKQGVGSAVNDVTREVGGALGIAVLGSLLNDQYRSAVAGAAGALPAALGDRVEQSLGFTLQLTARGGEPFARLAETAKAGWVDGLSAALLAAAIVLAATAVTVGALLRQAPTALRDHTDGEAARASYAGRRASS